MFAGFTIKIFVDSFHDEFLRTRNSSKYIGKHSGHFDPNLYRGPGSDPGGASWGRGERYFYSGEPRGVGHGRVSVRDGGQHHEHLRVSEAGAQQLHEHQLLRCGPLRHVWAGDAPVAERLPQPVH